MHFLWHQQGPDTQSAGRCIERMLPLCSQPGAGSQVGRQRGYSLLALIRGVGAFWEAQLPLSPADSTILLTAWGWEGQPRDQGWRAAAATPSSTCTDTGTAWFSFMRPSFLHKIFLCLGCCDALFFSVPFRSYLTSRLYDFFSFILLSLIP